VVVYVKRSGLKKTRLPRLHIYKTLQKFDNSRPQSRSSHQRKSNSLSIIFFIQLCISLLLLFLTLFLPSACTLKFLHFGLMTIGVLWDGRLTVRHISDRVGLGHFSGPRSPNLGFFPVSLPVLWFPQLPTSDPQTIPSRFCADSFDLLPLWDSERIEWWQGADRRRVPHGLDRAEFATLPKSISFHPKPRWISDSYNFLANVEEKTSACWFVTERDKTQEAAVNRP
jgi:hypothetical protein